MNLKNLYPSLVAIILVACTSVQNGNDTLDQYHTFLSTLDTLKVESATTAAKKYKALFKNEEAGIRDQGFVLFSNYYEKLNGALNSLHEKDSTDYEPLYMVDVNGKALPAPKKLKAFNDNLKKNGFQISFTEGISYIQEDRDFIAKWFYSSVSSTMKIYLEQLNKENKEGFQDDAELMIDPKHYVNRLVWWDNFIDKHANFIQIDAAKERRKYLLTFFLIGMDNSPVLSDDGKSLTEYFESAYNYLQNNFSKTETNTIVNPYFKAMERHDDKTGMALLDAYRKQGIILSFSAD